MGIVHPKNDPDLSRISPKFETNIETNPGEMWRILANGLEKECSYLGIKRTKADLYEHLQTVS